MVLRRPVPLWAALVAFALGLLPLAFIELYRQPAPDSVKKSSAAPLKTGEVGSKPPIAVEPERQAPERQKPPGPSATEAEQAEEILRLQGQLAAANQAINRLETRMEETLNELRLRTGENTRLAKQAAEVSEQLAATRRVVEAMGAEMEGKGGRIAQLETWLTAEREARKEESAKLAKEGDRRKEIEGIYQRRDTYLSNILRHYGDLSSQYRTLAVDLDRPADNCTPPAGVLSRIQNTITMADQDVRELRALNQKAAALTRIDGRK